MRSVPPVLALLLLAGCPVEPDDVPPTITLALEARPDVEAAVEAEVELQGLVGATFGVGRTDTVVFLHGVGFEDREAEVPVDPHATLYRWASLSKGLTGIAAVQAEDAELLSLDDEVADHLDEYEVPDQVLPTDCTSTSCAEPLPAADRHVTLRQLLHHVGGAQHYTNGTVNPVPPVSRTDDPETNTGIAWALDYWIDAPLVAVPGTTYSYSTFGFNLAGAVVERAAGVPFGTLVVEGIGGPFGMDTLSLDRAWDEVPRRAVGYLRVGETIVRDGDNDVSWKAPGGGFQSSGADLTRYCAGLLGETLMPAEVRNGLLWEGTGAAPAYGLGFSVYNDREVVSHTGGQQSTRTAIAWLPAEDLCFTAMTSSTWADPWQLLTALVTAWQNLEQGTERGASRYGPDPTPEARDPW